MSKPLTAHHLEKLTLFQQFILVLMKLRLNLTNQDLGYRFAVSESTAVKIIHKWIQLMYVHLKPVIVWPEREVSRKTLPRQFRKHFGRCVVIIDCFEIFCERPRKLMARSQTYSNYKSHNTVKVLISVTPQGKNSFILRAWGGRTSDKHLTEHCAEHSSLQDKKNQNSKIYSLLASLLLSTWPFDTQFSVRSRDSQKRTCT